MSNSDLEIAATEIAYAVRMTVFDLKLGDIVVLRHWRDDRHVRRHLVTRVEDILLAGSSAASCGCMLNDAGAGPVPVHRRVTVNEIDGGIVRYGNEVIESGRDDYRILERQPGICTSPTTPCASQGG